MIPNGLMDITTYRVRLPRDLYPYRGSHVIAIRPARDVDPTAAEWVPVERLSDRRCEWAGAKKGDFFMGRFCQRNSFNIPGPFYGAMTDTCATGPHEAPNNVLLDGRGQEFVFKRSANIEELRNLIGAALCEPFSGYGAVGNDHWTLPLIRDWWRGRTGFLARRHELEATNRSTAPWESFLTGQAENYLRVYAFFVEEGRLPKGSDRLPDVL